MKKVYLLAILVFILGIIVIVQKTESQNELTLDAGVYKILQDSATLDFAATTGCESLTIPVTGAANQDPCFIGAPQAAMGLATSQFTCGVTATNVVTVKHCANGTSQNPASGRYKVILFKTL